ncbi:hypothetical protein [Dyadobacter sediminis]|uniref:Uncharacterized protein n=2 Tax=Dyadobacter sediminis TaxID=1493691 RepID=A0A5R9K7E2_9BACT|nr:hypothetical protein [Dyadobacter sediminis]TLU89792.1 hypothetical protein FEM55_19850 [Dyadobacter sediminis]GGC12784.1 hypothetical protein GCM10011325_44540 [Dyadobacter sediminis]
MNSLEKCFSLYKINYLLSGTYEYILLRTEKKKSPDCYETSTPEKDADKSSLVSFYTANNCARKLFKIEMIGEFHNSSLEEYNQLHSAYGMFELPVIYMNTSFGFPWIVLGSFNRIDDFNRELFLKTDLLALSPVGQPQQITATLLTENDLLHAFN